MRAEGERTGSTERMMGSDSGLSGRTGCPEECEAGAVRWQRVEQAVRAGKWL